MNTKLMIELLLPGTRAFLLREGLECTDAIMVQAMKQHLDLIVDNKYQEFGEAVTREVRSIWTAGS
jgi:hypothetical protein